MRRYLVMKMAFLECNKIATPGRLEIAMSVDLDYSQDGEGKDERLLG